MRAMIMEKHGQNGKRVNELHPENLDVLALSPKLKKAASGETAFQP